jgi:hypothetical protein
VGWLAYLNQAKVDQAMRSCWSVGGVRDCHEGLDGLLTANNTQPMANYWVYLLYGQMDGQRELSLTTSSARTVGMASRDPSTGAIRLLLGRFCNYADSDMKRCYANATTLPGAAKDVNIRITRFAGANAVVQVQRIPNNFNLSVAFDPSTQPARAAVQPVTNGNLTVTLPAFADDDAYAVVITPQ